MYRVLREYLKLRKQGKLEGGLYRGGGGALITGCISLFPSRWAYNQGGLVSGGGAYNRNFTV